MIPNRTMHYLTDRGVIQLVGLPYAVILSTPDALNYCATSPVPCFDDNGLTCFTIRDAELDADQVDWIYAQGGAVTRSVAVQTANNGGITTEYVREEVWPASMEMPWAARNNDVPTGITGRMDEDEVRTWAEWVVASGVDWTRSLDDAKVLFALSFVSQPITVPEVLILKAAGGTILSQSEAAAAKEPGGEYTAPE